MELEIAQVICFLTMQTVAKNLVNNQIYSQCSLKTSLKGFSASKCNVGNWIFLGGFFGEDFFGRNSLGGILTLLKSAKLFEYGRN